MLTEIGKLVLRAPNKTRQLFSIYNKVMMSPFLCVATAVWKNPFQERKGVHSSWEIRVSS